MRWCPLPMAQDLWQALGKLRRRGGELALQGCDAPGLISEGDGEGEDIIEASDSLKPEEGEDAKDADVSNSPAPWERTPRMLTPKMLTPRMPRERTPVPMDRDDVKDEDVPASPSPVKGDDAKDD